jgi:hypothetical protein
LIFESWMSSMIPGTDDTILRELDNAYNRLWLLICIVPAKAQLCKIIVIELLFSNIIEFRKAFHVIARDSQ